MYDYPIDIKKLENYHVGDIQVIHEEEKIILIFYKKDIIPAAGIFYYKWENIDDDYKDFLDIVINNKKTIIEMSINSIIDICAEYDCNKYTLEIKCDVYNMKQEKGIICYYNTDEMYNNELLHNIINK